MSHLRSEIATFLDAYGSGDRGHRHEEFFLSLPFLWKIQFHYQSRILLPNINRAIRKGYSSNDQWRAVTEPDRFVRSENVIAAREVVIPGENSQFDIAGAENMGGFLPGYALNKRTDFLSKNLIVNFFETQDDLEHNFFRPWMIAIGIDGLINRNLLCTVVVKQYNNRMGFRKGYVFEDVFPTNVEGFTLNYEDGEFLEKSITMAFRHYKPLTNRTSQWVDAAPDGVRGLSERPDAGRGFRDIAGIPQGRFPGR